MVVNDLDVLGASSGPAEADPPLVVDPDAVLTLPIAAKGLKPISRWHAQVVQAGGNLELAQLTASHGREALETPDALPTRERLGVRTPPGSNHEK
jgi:hypothetical protein